MNYYPSAIPAKVLGVPHQNRFGFGLEQGAQFGNDRQIIRIISVYQFRSLWPRKEENIRFLAPIILGHQETYRDMGRQTD